MILYTNLIENKVLRKIQKIFYITIIFMVLPLLVDAQNISRGFKNYEKAEYLKAEEIFLKYLNTDSLNAAAHFALAVIYSTDNFTGKDYFKAWTHNNQSREQLKNLTEADKKEMADFLLFLEERKSNWSLEKKFEVQSRAIETKLIRYVREEKDLDMVKTFIEKFPNSNYYENVVHIRNYLEFAIVRKENTVESYNRFIKDYPDATQVPSAIKKRNALAYQQAITTGTLASIENFINQYIGTEQYPLALKRRNELAYEMAIKKNTPEAIDEFIKAYPDAIQVAQGKKIQMELLYAQAKKINTYEAFQIFIAKFPQGEFFFDIFNLKANSLGNKYLKNSSYDNAKVEWVKAFDRNGGNDRANSIHIDSKGSLILTGTTMANDSVRYIPWIIKLKEDGRLDWEKVAEIQGSVTLIDAIINSNDEIAFIGTKQLNDSIGPQSWYALMAPNGKFYWEKSLSKKQINGFCLDNNNNFLLAGNEVDSMGIKHMYAGCFKNTSRKLWERSFSGTGMFQSVCPMLTNGYVFAGGNLIYRLDSEGYLAWEKLFSPSDSITHLQTLNDKEYLTCGIKNNTDIFINKLDIVGKISMTKTFDAGSNEGIENVHVSNNNIYISGHSGSNGYFINTNSGGQVVQDYMFGGKSDFKIKQAVPDGLGNIYLLISNNDNQGDYILVKLKSN